MNKLMRLCGLPLAYVTVGSSGQGCLAASNHANASNLSAEYLEVQAECVLKGKIPKSLDQFFSLDPYSKEAGELGAKLSNPNCMASSVSEMRFSTPLLRGALYRAIYIRNFGLKAPLPEADQPTLDIEHEIKGNNDSNLNGYIILRKFSDCVVREDALNVRALIVADTASSDEGNALQALQADLGACLLHGQQVKFSKIELRGYLAEALYRLSVAAHVHSIRS